MSQPLPVPALIRSQQHLLAQGVDLVPAGSLALFRFSEAKTQGPLIAVAASSPSSEGVQMRGVAAVEGTGGVGCVVTGSEDASSGASTSGAPASSRRPRRERSGWGWSPPAAGSR